jgi:hypothetical protein
LALVPGELPPPDFGDGATPTPPEPDVLVFVVLVVFVVLEPVLVCVFVVVGVLGVLAVGGVLAVLDVAGAVAAAVVLLACLEPPHAPIASAAINTPES